MGQNAQRRTHFTSPLLATAEQHGTKQTLEKEKGEEQSPVSVSANSKSMGFLSPSFCSLDTKKLHTSDPDSGRKTAVSGLARPHRLDFCQDHPVCDKMASSSIMNESADSERQEQDNRRQQLQASIKEKEDVLRKLRLVQFYENKHDLGRMEELIRKWYQVCQEGLVDLLNLMPEPHPELTELIDHLGIDHSMIGYNKEDQSFTAYTE